jgi:hypothetical protein
MRPTLPAAGGFTEPPTRVSREDDTLCGGGPQVLGQGRRRLDRPHDLPQGAPNQGARVIDEAAGFAPERRREHLLSPVLRVTGTQVQELPGPGQAKGEQARFLSGRRLREQWTPGGSIRGSTLL